MWRCFFTTNAISNTGQVFSTYVEVFPGKTHLAAAIASFLHVCGGVSGSGHFAENRQKFSPRMWRCFQEEQDEEAEYQVFSTYVEVFPYLGFLVLQAKRFLHVCGGVSYYVKRCDSIAGFSPRMWRCFCKKQKDRKAL